MSLSDEFLQLLPLEIEKQHGDLSALRKILIRFRDNGMDKETMLENMEELRGRSASGETEDILLELMDFITGWCAPGQNIFDKPIE